MNTLGKIAKIICSIIGGIFILIGAIVLIVSFIVNNHYTKVYDNCNSVIGEVIQTNNLNSSTVIEYEVKGSTYTKTFSAYTSELHTGSYVTVYYDKNDVTEAYVKEFTGIINFILNILGGIFLGIGILLIIIILVITSALKKRLKNNINNNYGYNNYGNNNYNNSNYSNNNYGNNDYNNNNN